MDKSNELFMIGNAHLDPVWLWNWQEGYQEVKATFRSALDRMKEFPDFIFTCSSSCFYEWVEDGDPEMFEEIKQRVKEGRWAITGGFYIQPDCLAPCGESFVRQGLYAQHYFREKFGKMSQTGYNVDSFGHNAMLPQILSKLGMKNYVFMRPSSQEKALVSGTFSWQSADGSSVNTFRIPYEYCTWGKELSMHVERCEGEIRKPIDSIMCFYGVGNHGGGPTIENIKSIKKMNKDPKFPKLTMASPDDYFDKIKKSKHVLPVIQGDLLHHASGCYAAHSEIKQINRKAENRIILAEKWSSLANIITGISYPLDDFTKAWKRVLFNQFHDILAGTSIKSAYDDAKESYGESLNLSAISLNRALQSISWKIKIPYEDNTKPLVVFNSHAFGSLCEIEIESSLIKPNMKLVDDLGKQINYQLVQSEATANGRSRISFVADVPSLGYRTYKIKTIEDKDFVVDASSKIICTDNMVQNKFFRLKFGKDNGLNGIYINPNDKSIDESKWPNLVEDSSGIGVVIDDPSDTWSHNILRFEKVEGICKPVSLKRIEHGPVKSVIRSIVEYNQSRIIQDYHIYKDLDHVEVRVTCDWREKRKILKLSFPTKLIFRKSTAQTPYGNIDRETNGIEYPMQTWIDLSGSIIGEDSKIYGLSLITDSKSSYDVTNRTINLTALRSPIYAHHDPAVPDENLEYQYLDQGISSFSYIIYPHKNSWEKSNVVQKAMGLNQRAVAYFESFHEDGTLPQSDSYIKIDNESIVLSAMKLSEDKTGVILRLHNTKNSEGNCQVEFTKLNRKISSKFKAQEINSFIIPFDKKREIEKVNLIEETIKD